MKILFLSTWFPYPPNQGSKNRALHLLKALASRHEVALVSFEDVEIAPEWRAEIQKLCPVVETLARKPFAARRTRTWQGWLSSKPSAVVAIHSPEMSELVRKVAREWKPDCVVALTFVCAPYALEVAGTSKVLDIDNVMARMLAEAIPFATSRPDRLRRWLAYHKFMRYEKEIYPQFDLCLVVTESDRADIQRWIPFREQALAVVPNGVDTASHAPGLAAPVPDTLVFNGALTYNANYDAMDYFLREIFPEIVRRKPGTLLKITGKTDGVALDQLPHSGNVQWTGYLDDIRPVIAASWVCVAPLRIGGGTRLKILEAMALGTPVISTTKGAEGLGARDGFHLLIADTPEAFIRQTLRLMDSPDLRQTLAQNARQFVLESYDWNNIGKAFRHSVERLVDGDSDHG